MSPQPAPHGTAAASRSAGTTEAQRIRALAHPLRLELLEILEAIGPATATECAERLGGAVSSCSYHLRMLAKYGYIERAQGHGKERPWQLVADSQHISGDPEEPLSVRASGELALAMIDHEARQLRSSLSRRAQGSRDSEGATSVVAASTWLTHEELQDLEAQLRRIFGQYTDRWRDPALRPAGARPVRLFAATALKAEG